MSMSKTNKLTRLLAAIMAAVLAFGMTLPVGSMAAWAAGDDDKIPEAVVVNTIITNDGKQTGTISSTAPQMSPKSTTDETKRFDIVVNPNPGKASSKLKNSNNMYVVLDKDGSGDPDKQIIIQLLSSGYKTMKAKVDSSITDTAEDDTNIKEEFVEVTGGTAYDTDDFAYDADTGNMTFDKKYQNYKQITVYNYIQSTNIAESYDIFGSMKLDTVKQTLTWGGPGTPDIGQITYDDSSIAKYIGKKGDAINAVMSQMTNIKNGKGLFGGYTINTTKDKDGKDVKKLDVYSVTLDSSNKVKTVFPLTEGSDYSVGLDNSITLKSNLLVSNILIIADISSPDNSTAVDPIIVAKTTGSITVSAVNGYKYSIYTKDASGYQLAKPTKTSEDVSKDGKVTFAGLSSGTNYWIQYENANGVKSSMRPVKTADEFVPYKFDFEVGQTYSTRVYVGGHWNGHLSISGGSFSQGNTIFSCSLQPKLGDPNVDSNAGRYVWSDDPAKAEGAAQLNEIFTGAGFNASCISPGAGYSSGHTKGATLKVISANTTTGAVQVLVSMNGAWYAGGKRIQNIAGNITRPGSQPMQIELTKASTIPAITNGNANYSLAGARYGIYGDAGCTAYVADMFTDAEGYAVSDPLTAGSYWVKEIDPPKNMSLNATVYPVSGAAGQSVQPNNGAPLPETPMTKDWEFFKIDKQSGLPAGQAGATVQGAEFAVNYYASATNADQIADKAPTRSWTLASDADGKVKLDDAHRVAGDDLYKNEKGEYVCPCGVYTIQETKAPVGYKDITEGTPAPIHNIVMSTSDEQQRAGEATVTHPAGTSTMDRVRNDTENGADAYVNQVKRGDLEFIKHNEENSKAMPGVPFLLTNVQNGETHVLVTDEMGKVSTADSWNHHTLNTNKNDEAVSGYTINKDADGKYSADISNVSVDESKLDDEAGVFFKGYNPEHEGYERVSVKDDHFGIPFGNYILQELPCSATQGLQLLNIPVNIKRDVTVVDAGTLVDHVAHIVHTTATDQNTQDHEGDPNHEMITILDDVDYSGLTVGEEYALTATLHVKVFHEDGSVTDGGPLMVDGNPVTVTEPFVPTAPSGTHTMRFTIPGSALVEKSVVAFESLTKDGIEVGFHNDIADEGQTVNYPSIHTMATDSATGDHEGNAIDDEITISDDVFYTGLTPGKEYTMKGILMDKETGNELVDDEGKPFTAEITFYPEATSGAVTLTYTVPTKYVAGKAVVVFENLSNVRGPITSHADINDEDQTVYYPAIHTTATDSVTKSHEGLANETITINDLVEYENLIKGETYTISGKIMDKGIGEALKGADGDEFTASATFVAGKDMTESEEVKEARALIKAYADTAKNMLELFDDMDAADIQALAKKAGLDEMPSLNESMIQEIVDVAAKDGSKGWTDEQKQAIEDFDKVYLAMSEEQQKETGELVSPEKLTEAVDVIAADAKAKEEAEKEEAAADENAPVERVSGSVIVSFEIPADIVRGKATVVFENLYFGEEPSDENHKAKHEDINDEGQTVVYPEIGTQASIGGQKIAPARDVIVVTDTVEYKNFTPNKEYVISGVLMDKVTNETVKNDDGTDVTGTTTFTPEAADGTVDVTFTFNAMAIQFHDVVVFEEAQRKSDVADELILVAEHKDIDDADQTVRIDDAGLADELIETGPLLETGDIIFYLLVTGIILSGSYWFAFRHRKRNLFD